MMDAEEWDSLDKQAESWLKRLAGEGARISGVCLDSRAARPGDLFLAWPGAKFDARLKAAEAAGNGAAAVLWEPGGGANESQLAPQALGVPSFAAENLRALAGFLAQKAQGSPSAGMDVVAVTGTNGKTTVSSWIAQALGMPCGLIGTLGYGMPGATGYWRDSALTTPDAGLLAKAMAEFAEAGAKACAMEASSAGLAAGRMGGVSVSVAVFTNLTRDHLDVHGTMEEYFAAKAGLFGWPGLKLAVVNMDDPMGASLAACSSARRVWGYGVGARDDGRLVWARDLAEGALAQSFVLVSPGGEAKVETKALGKYNVSNLLAAASVLLAAGMPVEEAARRLSDLEPPAGRMQRIGGDGAPLAVVDYAHTPDALENVLRALRPAASARGGKLWAVFGCGGDRDPGKRPMMGASAAALADCVVVTSDNPRSEDPGSIMEAVLQGARSGASQASVFGIEDRSEAIAFALDRAADADVVLLAGKGHEGYQEKGGERLPFSDCGQAKAALDRRKPAG